MINVFIKKKLCEHMSNEDQLTNVWLNYHYLEWLLMSTFMSNLKMEYISFKDNFVCS